MRKSIILLGCFAALAGCGTSSEQGEANNAATNASAPAKPIAYCFFQDDQTKEWKAKADRKGDVIVTGKVFRSDPRYKAVLEPGTVSGTTAHVSPTLIVNDTGFAAPGNWWDVSQTIPNSAAVATVDVTCGAKTIASLPIHRKK